MPQIYLDIREAAEALGCTTQNVAKLIRTGSLDAKTEPTGGSKFRYLIPQTSIDKYKAKRENERPNWRTQGKQKRRE
jgi:hypothetical protein